MTDPTDKKSKERRDSFTVDLDAMLDEAESSLHPVRDLQDDEDAIDRLLMNAGFDADEALMPTETDKSVGAVKDDGLRDELDDFLSFDDFDDDFNRPEQTQAAMARLDQTAQDSADTSQDDEDDLDRLLMNAGFDTDDAQLQSKAKEDVDAFEEWDDFSDFNNVNESGRVAQKAPKADDAKQTTGTSSTEVADEVNEFFGLGGEFDESDSIQDDELEIPAVADLTAADERTIKPISDDRDAIDKLLQDADVDAGDTSAQTDDFPDIDSFSDDFDVSELIQDDEIEAATNLAPPKEQQIAEPSSAAGVPDQTDDFSTFGDDFDLSDLIQDDEAEAATNLAPPKEQQVAEPSSAAEPLDQTDDFSAFGDDFDLSDLIQDDEVEAKADLAPPKEQQVAEPSSAAEPPDQADDFSAFGDDFDLSDLIQDDEVEAAADLASPKEQQIAEPSSAAEPPDQADDFSVFGDDFDASDLIQDDEAETSASAALLANKAKSDGPQDDDIDSLLMEPEPAIGGIQGQTAEKKDEFDDTDLDEFFQLDEVSDDFSEQSEEILLEKAEKPSDQDNLEDDFLLPDFDITADTEVSTDIGLPAKGSNDGIEDELANTFGDSDFLNENEVAPKTAELKSATDSTAADEHENIKFNPFEFEQEDLKKQLDEAENKVKKTKRYGYIALGVGVVAISAAAGLGFMTYSAKTEVSKLTETVSTLEAKLAKNSANNPEAEINAMRNSVVQLNQQLEGFITELKETPQLSVDLLNSKVPDIAVKQDMVSKALDMLQAKIKGEEKLSSLQAVIEPSKAEAKHEHAPTKEESAHESAPSKEASAHKTAPAKEEAAHDIASAKEKTNHETAPTKERALHETPPAKVEAAHETVAVKVKVQPEPVKAKPITIEKAIVKKEEPVIIERPTAPGKWAVNLVAVKQEWYANSKVAEFARRGIFAEIVPIQGNNTTMYRLRVGGFKSKAEANSNKARIKQALNLDSVWVSDN